MELSIKGKNAIVCASSQGLGKSAAIDLAKEGVNLALCSRSKEKVDAVKEEISKISDVKVVSVETDLNSSKDIKEFYKKAHDELGSINILINNNGGPPPSTFEELSDEDWQKAFNATMMSAIRLSKLVLPNMKENKWGRIINISSISVKTPVTGEGTSKFTLSVSSSTIGSSASTVSPSFFNHLAIVASVMLSPSTGTNIFSII